MIPPPGIEEVSMITRKAITRMNILAIPKTILFNFRYFPFREALKFPVIVSHRVKLLTLGGEVEIQGEKKTGMVKIGFGNVPIFDASRSRGIWRVTGKVVFEGRAYIGHGSKIWVDDNGTLVLGDGFKATAETAIACIKSIRFGKDCLISWSTFFTDTDFHRMFDENGNVTNAPADVEIGDRVWVGYRALVFRGSHIPDDSVVGANSLVNSRFEEKSQLIAGSPAITVKKNIKWKV